MDQKSISEFTIDRKVWLRAEPSKDKGEDWKSHDPTGSYLLREIDRKRCCIGIYLQACGVPDEAVEGVASPGYLFRERPAVRDLIPGWLINRNTVVGDGRCSVAADTLMSVNDDDTTDDATKEGHITEMFAAEGVKVVFV